MSMLNSKNLTHKARTIAVFLALFTLTMITPVEVKSVEKIVGENGKKQQVQPGAVMLEAQAQPEQEEELPQSAERTEVYAKFDKCLVEWDERQNNTLEDEFPDLNNKEIERITDKEIERITELKVAMDALTEDRKQLRDRMLEKFCELEETIQLHDLWRQKYNELHEVMSQSKSKSNSEEENVFKEWCQSNENSEGTLLENLADCLRSQYDNLIDQYFNSCSQFRNLSKQIKGLSRGLNEELKAVNPIFDELKNEHSNLLEGAEDREKAYNEAKAEVKKNLEERTEVKKKLEERKAAKQRAKQEEEAKQDANVEFSMIFATEEEEEVDLNAQKKEVALAVDDKISVNSVRTAKQKAEVNMNVEEQKDDVISVNSVNAEQNLEQKLEKELKVIEEVEAGPQQNSIFVPLINIVEAPVKFNLKPTEKLILLLPYLSKKYFEKNINSAHPDAISISEQQSMSDKFINAICNNSLYLDTIGRKNMGIVLKESKQFIRPI